ncbi:MAG: hypothetical protein ACRBBP_02320 [Bdellovibrionales bacterium]
MISEGLKILFTFFFGFSAFFLDPAADLKEKVKILPPPEGVEYFHFGFKDSFADMFWLGFIQSAFDCSKYKDPNKEYCPYRWGYKTLNTASILAPKFEALYKFGAVKLTVLLDDHEGAAELFERGLSYITDSWVLNYRAAYLYLQELKDFNRAGKLLENAAVLGAPFWTRSLASRMYNKSGQLELGYRILEDLHRESPEGPWRTDLEERMAKIAEKLRASGELE